MALSVRERELNVSSGQVSLPPDRKLTVENQRQLYLSELVAASHEELLSGHKVGFSLQFLETRL